MTVCRSCGSENPDGFRFCGRCGADLAAGTASGVRKTVTVVFCDLVGSTALGEQSDPEVLREIMVGYHADLRTILERHGGTVEKFVGDAAMAVFGLPHVHEDDALRAVRAAAEMRDVVGRRGLEVRIGLNTGEVVSGAGETLVTGDAVNVAARLEQAAYAGEVLIGEHTERLVRDAVRTEPVTPLVAKGKSEPVPAFRLLEVLPDAPAFTRRVDAPFVGRSSELADLDRAFDRAIAERLPQLCTLVGAPGIGKSRLAREFLGRVGGRARVVVGRCLPYGEGITYWPLGEIVRQVGGAAPHDRIAEAVGADEGVVVADRLAGAIGLGPPGGSPEETAWAARKLFEALAHDRPLIAVFDDVHWAESALLDLIEYVVGFATDVPLLVLCTARGDLFDARPSWSSPRPQAMFVALEPLDRDQVEALVGELDEVDASTREKIVEAADGNPLFVEQLVAMHAETGDGKLEVPPTLQALLSARIDRLGAEERAVIERASIEGRLFHRNAVAQLLAEPAREALGSHLMALVRKELIRPDRSLFAGDDAFRFGHVLVRDTAYESMPKRLRSDLHERFASWFETKLADRASEYEEILGYHLEQAYRYGEELGVGASALASRAAEKLGSAGRRALDRGDVDGAGNLLARAAAVLEEHDPIRIELQIDLGETLLEAGRLEDAEALLADTVDRNERSRRFPPLCTSTDRAGSRPGPDARIGDPCTDAARARAARRRVRAGGGSPRRSGRAPAPRQARDVDRRLRKRLRSPGAGARPCAAGKGRAARGGDRQVHRLGRSLGSGARRARARALPRHPGRDGERPYPGELSRPHRRARRARGPIRGRQADNHPGASDHGRARPPPSQGAQHRRRGRRRGAVRRLRGGGA